MSFAKGPSAVANKDRIASDINNFMNIWNKQIEPNIEKLNETNVRVKVKAAMNKMDPLVNKIQKEIGQCTNQTLKKNYEEVNGKYQGKKTNILQLIKKFESEEKTAKEAESKAQGEAANGEAMLDQQQIDQETEDLRYADQQVGEIVEDMKVLNELTKKVDNQVTKDHEVLIKIDNTVDDAKVEMVEGNKDLEKAEEHQKSCTIY